ncbi:N-acetyltransferase [Actinospica sp. MGRD01-02]|uniref:N-acetyltransferase n=1 Tax=Actinospica acidithermotolerans TaxID=2828514 RepID=A0A941E7B6_9ACTN|nr:GNAT family N-acetyltransferase [Actinospica acidithermotolerans]MBR7826416.1 N-acetyltransferase [Actinospica acidithermotolerans]
MSEFEVVPMAAEHADAVLAIYQAGLDTGNASFQTAAPDWPTFDAGKLPLHRFVAVAAQDGAVLGWVAVSAVSSRPVYAGVVEVSVYVSPDARGGGVGRALLARVIESTEAAGVWTLQAGIFPENVASLALHERAGFRTLGVQEKIGKHGERGWRDVARLERRSPIVF